MATDGDDAAGGTSDQPWATLQKAADTAPPGAMVYVRGGTYAQRVELHVSGEPGRPITFAPAPDETVVLDGSSLEVPAEQWNVVPRSCTKLPSSRMWSAAPVTRMPIGTRPDTSLRYPVISNPWIVM